jgi:hypothetical protein
MEEFVSKYYRMNPDEDMILFDGGRLRDGMMVLVEDPNIRATDYSDTLPSGDTAWFHKLRQANRWCVVKDVLADPLASDHHCRNRHVRFIGIYEGGEEMFRSYPLEVPWLAKKETVPPNDGHWGGWSYKKVGVSSSDGLWPSVSRRVAAEQKKNTSPMSDGEATFWENRKEQVDSGDTVPDLVYEPIKPMLRYDKAAPVEYKMPRG